MKDHRRAVFARLVDQMLHHPDRSASTRVTLASAEICGAQGASLMLNPIAVDRLVVCATDATAAALADTQDVLGEGPTMRAAALGRPVSCDLDGAPENDFPVFQSTAAAELGALSITALPFGDESGLGRVMTFHHAPDRDVVDRLRELTPVLHDLAVVGVADRDDALARRSVIQQAIGMVIIQAGVSILDAFTLLRARAFSEDTDLLFVAGDIVRRARRFE